MRSHQQNGCNPNCQGTLSKSSIPNQIKGDQPQQGGQGCLFEHHDDRFDQKGSSLLCQPHSSIYQPILDEGFSQSHEQTVWKASQTRKFHKGKVRSDLKIKDEQIFEVSLTEGLSRSTYSMLQGIFNNINSFIRHEEKKMKDQNFGSRQTSNPPTLSTAKNKTHFFENQKLDSFQDNFRQQDKSRSQLITIFGSSSQQSEQVPGMSVNYAFVEQSNCYFSKEQLSYSESSSENSSCLGCYHQQQKPSFSSIEETETKDNYFCQCEDITCLRGKNRNSPLDIFYCQRNNKLRKMHEDMEENLLSFEIRKLHIGSNYEKKLRLCPSVISDCMAIEPKTNLNTKTVSK